jgi:hypothetical protein
MGRCLTEFYSGKGGIIEDVNKGHLGEEKIAVKKKLYIIRKVCNQLDYWTMERENTKIFGIPN